MNGKYDETISTSKEESLLIATQILLEELESNKATIKRPGISLKKTLVPHLIALTVYVLILAGWFIFGKEYELQGKFIFIPIALIAAVVLIRVKKTVVDAILIYQQYAPERIRDACVFTPTCSEYMLIAIEKYGAFKGVIKGIGRLLRCHYPNGGEDYP